MTFGNKTLSDSDSDSDDNAWNHKATDLFFKNWEINWNQNISSTKDRGGHGRVNMYLKKYIHTVCESC